MYRLKSVHWLAPTTMVFAWTVGTMLALGHHIFYASLDHDPVSTAPYHFAGKALPKQQFNTSVGTAFAFLVRTFLGVAVSTAYIQIFWRSIKNATKASTLEELDWAHSGLDNVFGLFNVRLWWRHPISVLLALIFWCTPIATIFPPATLSVQSVPRASSSMLQVPQHDFTTFNYAKGLQYDSSGGPLTDWDWHGPSQPVQHLALAVMGLGQILPITAPVPNASWTLDFWGPALQCNDVEPAKRNRIWINIWNSYNASTTGAYAFLSWVPWSYVDSWYYYINMTASGIDRDLPFFLNHSEIGAFPVGPATSSVSTDGPASFFVAVLPQSLNLSITTNSGTYADYDGIVWENCPYDTVESLDEPMSGCAPGNTTFTPSLVYEDSTLLRCDLVNTSYRVDFNYSSGTQNVRIQSNITGDSPIVNGSAYFLGPQPPGLSTAVLPANCSSFLSDPYPDAKGTPCEFDIDALRLVSYQGIMAAFNQLLLGSIQNQGGSLAPNTTIMRTILAQTEELAPLRDWDPTFLGQPSLQKLISGMHNGWAYAGLSTPNPPDSHGSLSSTLEQLFQNFTISLLAEPYLQPNYSSVFAPAQLTNVSLFTYHNEYNYDSVTLWIAYGLSILSTLIAVAVGLATVLLTGASYSNNFSTIFRVSRAANLSVPEAGRDYELGVADADGRDPLPRSLRKARLIVDGGRVRADSTTVSTIPERGKQPEEMRFINEIPSSHEELR